MKLWISAATLLSSGMALAACSMLAGSEAPVASFSWKFFIFILPLAIILVTTLFLIMTHRKRDLSQLLMIVVVIPNVMMVPLVVIWVSYTELLTQVFKGG